MNELDRARELAAQASSRFYEVDNRVIADRRQEVRTEGLLDEWNKKRGRWRAAEAVLARLQRPP